MKELIKEALLNHPEFIKKKYRGNKNPLFGHCYTASEVYYYLNGKWRGLSPYCMKIKGGTHWFLKNGKEIVDLTCGDTEYDYSKGKHVPFLTKKPSKKARTIMKEIENKFTAYDDFCIAYMKMVNAELHEECNRPEKPKKNCGGCSLNKRRKRVLKTSE